MNEYIKLSKEFYLLPTVEVAKKLLGKLFIRKIENQFLVGRITETEAYSPNDKASHSFNGKTKRNEMMFKEGGILYVYFIYGMYFCCNIVTEKKDFGSAVLLRSVEPIFGIEKMLANRNNNTKNMTNGPGKICEAFQISKKENGKSLLSDEIFIAENKFDTKKIKIKSSTRIGLKNGKDCDKKFRFSI